MQEKKAPTLSVPNGQESTHEIFVKYYENHPHQIEDEITRRLADKVWDGTRRSYYPSGKLWCEDTWREGKLWSIEVDLLPDGRPVEGASIKDGKGHQKLYSEEGVLTGEGERLDGKKEGLWVSYYPSGEKKEETHWSQNKPLGESKIFDEEGRVTVREEYTEDRCHHQKFGPDGALTMEGDYTKDAHGSWVKSGLWKTHEASGAVRVTNHDDPKEASRPYYDPEILLTAYRANQDVHQQAKAMINACGGSTIELDKTIWRLKGQHNIEISVPLRVAIACQPSVGFLNFARPLRFAGAEAVTLVERARAALLQGDPDGHTCLSVFLTAHGLSCLELPEEYDPLLYKASKAMHQLETKDEYGVGEAFRDLLSLLPMPRREAIVFGHATERTADEACLSLVGACPTEAALDAAIQRLSAPGAQGFSYMLLPSHLALFKALGDAAAERLCALDMKGAEVWRLLEYTKMLAATQSEKAAPRLCEFIHTKQVAKEVKRRLVELGDKALHSLEAEIKAQSGPKQARAAMILAALPKSAAKKASAAALLPLTSGKTADYLTKAAK